MQKKKYLREVLMLALLSLTIACEPMGPMPGRELSGTVKALPESWVEVNDVELVQIETSGPYSINVWGVGLKDGYYVASSKGKASKWSKKIIDDSLVKLRIGSDLYLLKAVIISDDNEVKAVAAGFKEKYDLDATVDFPDAIIYRLQAR